MTSLPFSADTASSAASTVGKSTKPKPLLFPVAASSITVADTGLYAWQTLLRSASVMSRGSFVTKIFALRAVILLPKSVRCETRFSWCSCKDHKKKIECLRHHTTSRWCGKKALLFLLQRIRDRKMMSQGTKGKTKVGLSRKKNKEKINFCLLVLINNN